jgi:uncharacterized integral membrane protein
MTHPPEDRPASTPDEIEPRPAPLSPDLVPPAETGLGQLDDTFPAPARRRHVKVPRTRTSAAWFGVWAGAVALVLLIIFVAQNTATVQVNFLWLSGNISLALALLIAGVGGAVVAMAVGAVRIVQLRRLVHRGS